MRKFAEFTSDKLLYQRIRHSRHRNRYRYLNLEDVLSSAQLTFLESKDYVIRPHPVNRNVRSVMCDNKFELFVDTDVLTERDDTIITLLFDNVSFR
jgi:hypothetical protein